MVKTWGAAAALATYGIITTTTVLVLELRRAQRRLAITEDWADPPRSRTRRRGLPQQRPRHNQQICFFSNTDSNTVRRPTKCWNLQRTIMKFGVRIGYCR